MSIPQSAQLDSLIPSGSWTLYFHSPEESKWTLTTFISLGSMRTWYDFWNIINTLQPIHLVEGGFFLMKDPIPPLWENHQNIRGGWYSFKSHKKDAADLYLQFSIAAMLNHITTSTDNKINGLSISLKRGFNIIKIWNNNAEQFNQSSDLISNFSMIRESDILYTPFIQKKM